MELLRSRVARRWQRKRRRIYRERSWELPVYLAIKKEDRDDGEGDDTLVLSKRVGRMEEKFLFV